jgi:hypothetical protein
MHINALISNYSYLDSTHFRYWDLLVTSLCNHFINPLFLYMFANPIFFIIHICCYVFMKSPICITMLYIFLICCLGFILEYVHLDMHIFSRFKIFKFPNTKPHYYILRPFAKGQTKNLKGLRRKNNLPYVMRHASHLVVHHPSLIYTVPYNHRSTFATYITKKTLRHDQSPSTLAIFHTSQRLVILKTSHILQYKTYH